MDRENIDKFPECKQLLQNEITVIQNTTHPNIVHIYEMLSDPAAYYIVSEYLRYGELYDLVKQRSSLNELGAMREVNV